MPFSIQNVDYFVWPLLVRSKLYYLNSGIEFHPPRQKLILQSQIQEDIVIMCLLESVFKISSEMSLFSHIIVSMESVIFDGRRSVIRSLSKTL